MEVPDNHPGCSAPLPFYSDSDSHVTVTEHQPTMVGSGLLIHCTYPIHILQYQPIDYHKHQSTISVSAQYTLEATIVLQVRYHRNDIVFFFDIHMNMYHAMYQYFMYHTVMCRHVNWYYHIINYNISWMYYYDTVVATKMVATKMIIG